jgi:chemotaxis protein MotB
MAETPEATHVTIIKRKKVVKADGHHGGAWKVAYADFVTAMMAFFLLMWLLNATTEEQRKGIADYFSPTIPISRISGGGPDGLDGSALQAQDDYIKVGTGVAGEDNADPGQDMETEEIAQDLEKVRRELKDDPQRLSEHLLVKMTPEGIVLEIVDSASRPLFEVGSSQPTPLLINLLDAVSSSLNSIENTIKIVGHTDNRKFRGEGSYDNWNLSSDRANTARHLLIDDGFPMGRISEVSGRADTDPLNDMDASAARNRRISVTILTNGLDGAKT